MMGAAGAAEAEHGGGEEAGTAEREAAGPAGRPVVDPHPVGTRGDREAKKARVALQRGCGTAVVPGRPCRVVADARDDDATARGHVKVEAVAACPDAADLS